MEGGRGRKENVTNKGTRKSKHWAKHLKWAFIRTVDEGVRASSASRDQRICAKEQGAKNMKGRAKRGEEGGGTGAEGGEGWFRSKKITSWNSWGTPLVFLIIE